MHVLPEQNRENDFTTWTTKAEDPSEMMVIIVQINSKVDFMGKACDQIPWFHF